MNYEERLQRMRQAVEGKRRKRWLYPKRGSTKTALIPWAILGASLAVGRFRPAGPIHDVFAVVDFATGYWSVTCPMPGDELSLWDYLKRSLRRKRVRQHGLGSLDVKVTSRTDVVGRRGSEIGPLDGTREVRHEPPSV